MRVSRGSVFAILLAAGFASAAAVADDIPTVQIPDAYLTGQAPAGVPGLDRPASTEKPAAINGTLYAVIAPTYDGSNGTQSFFRLFNGAATATTFSITVVGSPTGRTYGTGTVLVPSNASPQYSLSEIRTIANNAATLNGGDTSYAVYLQNPEVTAGYQHVTYNNGNGFFENASVCSRLLNDAIRTVSNSAVLLNVTTSVPTAYPSTVQIHNVWNAAVTYRFTVVAANDGAIKGSVNVQTAANASYSMPFTFFQNSVTWTPTASQIYANLIVTDVSGAAPSEILGQSIVNQTLSAEINMTTACAVNAAAASGGVADGGLNGY